MEMVAERLVAAKRDVVWACLNDPEALKACIPGCESIESTGPDSYKVAMVAAVGFIKAKFVGDLNISNKVEGVSYDLNFSGSGGPAGFGKGGASVALADAPAGTTLSYQVKAQVGGKLAQVGARIIDSVAKKMADEFFDRLDAYITAQAGGAPAVGDAAATSGGDAAAAVSTPAAAAATPPAGRSNRTMLYVAVGLALAAIVAVLASGG